jgi:hypothetical protein
MSLSVFSSTSAEKCLVQAAVHGDDLASSLAQELRNQQKIRFRLIGRCNGHFGQRVMAGIWNGKKIRLEVQHTWTVSM